MLGRDAVPVHRLVVHHRDRDPWADGQGRLGQLNLGNRAVGIPVVKIYLFEGRQIPCVTLSGSVIALLPLIKKDRGSYRGQYANDEDDDQELDEREPSVWCLPTV